MHYWDKNVNLETLFLRQCNILPDGGFLVYWLILFYWLELSLFCFQCSDINNGVVYVFLYKYFFLIRIISLVIELEIELQY